MAKLEKIDKILQNTERMIKTTNEVLRTNGEIVEAIQKFATKVDQRFDGVENRLDSVEGKIDKVESRLDKIETTMVTKSYLDDKLGDLRGDLVSAIKRNDTKINTLASQLTQEKSLTTKGKEKILALKPFPARL